MDYDECDNVTIEDYLKEDVTWHQLQDTESMTPLIFQWSHSSSYKLLLTALSIDSDNVFHGPRWNSEVPRFASNLQFTPLIPKKAANVSNIATSSDLKLVHEKQSEIVNADFQSSSKNTIKEHAEDVILSPLPLIRNTMNVESSNEVVRESGYLSSPGIYSKELVAEEPELDKDKPPVQHDMFNFLPDLSVLEANYIVLPDEIM